MYGVVDDEEALTVPRDRGEIGHSVRRGLVIPLEDDLARRRLPQLYVPPHCLPRVVDDHEPAEVRHDRQHGLERALEVVVGFLLVAVVVADRVGDGRPAVAQVPFHESGLLRELLRTVELDQELDRLGLGRLGLLDQQVHVVARHIAEERARLLQHVVVAVHEAPVVLVEIRVRRAVHPLGRPLQLAVVLLVRVAPRLKHVRGRHHPVERGARRQRVRAGLGGEPRRVVRVVVRLPPRARTAPEVRLGRAGALEVAVVRAVGRARQVGTRHVVLAQDVGDDLARDAEGRRGRRKVA